MSGQGWENRVGLLAGSHGDTEVAASPNAASGQCGAQGLWRSRTTKAVRWVVGSVLLLAAVSKLVTVSQTPSLATVLFGVHGDLLWAVVEMSVGAWLIAGWYVPVGLRVAVVESADALSEGQEVQRVSFGPVWPGQQAQGVGV